MTSIYYLYPYECIIDYLPLFSDRKLRALTDRAKQKLKSFEWNYKGIKDYYKQDTNIIIDNKKPPIQKLGYRGLNL